MLLSRSTWLYVGTLTVLGVIFALGSCVAASRGVRVSPETRRLWQLLVETVLAFWVRADRRTRQSRMPFEFDAFVFFLWPVVVPYYFCKTRELRGSLIALGVFALVLVPLAIEAMAEVTSPL